MSKANYDLHLNTDRLKTAHAGQARRYPSLPSRNPHVWNIVRAIDL